MFTSVVLVFSAALLQCVCATSSCGFVDDTPGQNCPIQTSAHSMSTFHGRSPPSGAYDFIIVGGGTAGVALAARLTEVATFNVLLIEAGTSPDTIDQQEEVPAEDFFLEGSNLDWNFTTINQPTLNGRSFLYTRGKCIGGSSVVNYMAFNRGSSSVFDLWSSLGNPGWDWDSVYPFFQKYAHFTPPNTSNNSQITYNSSYYLPSAGPLQISYGAYTQPYDAYVYPAFQEIGIPKITDLNGGEAVGVAHVTSTINPVDESRSSAYTTYFAEAHDRANFHVLTNTMATRILLNHTGSAAVAYGVEFKNPDGTSSRAHASKEVIISAGTFQTPQLLMLSGIGPQSVLDQFNIAAFVYNDGVGSRLQDHATLYVNVEVPSSLPTIGSALSHPQALDSLLAQYHLNHTGPLASTNGDTAAFQRLDDDLLASFGADDLIKLGSNWPNIEFLIAPSYYNPAFPTAPNDTGNYLTILAALVSPTSLGSVSISSTNIFDQPVIDVNYFSSTDDANVAVQALKNALAIVESNAFAPIFLGREKVNPGPNVQSDADLLEYARNTTTTIWHASGTSPMLPLESGGVVDSELRVYGVDNLRIVDASIQPRITNQHVQAVVYMIAEKAATMLKEQYS